MSLGSYAYVVNYRRPIKEFQFPRDVVLNTRWIKSGVVIYFIEGNKLRSVKVNGQDLRDIFTADSNIREYHFSPNGEYLLIAADQDLFLMHRKTQQSEQIDTLGVSPGQELKGVINGIRWAPDSQKFCYEISRWSLYSSQDSLFVYDLKNKDKRIIESPSRRLSSLYWDQQAENLYYIRHEAKDTSQHAHAFDVKVFRIPVEKEGNPTAGLTPEYVSTIPYEKNNLPLMNLASRNVDLFLEGDQFSFGRLADKESFVSETGFLLGIDQEDYLYSVKGKWFRKRFFKIPREPIYGSIAKYQYKGGELVLSEFRWLPGGRYVIMLHKDYGAMILEPLTGRIGHLFEIKATTFGWYQD